jgi:hypothetical protein
MVQERDRRFGPAGKISVSRAVLWDGSAETGAENSQGGAMSDEQRKDKEEDVEGHVRRGHVNEEPVSKDEDDDEVEAHVRKSNVRMDSPRHI